MNGLDNPWRGRDDSAEFGDTRRLFQVVRTAADGLPPGCPIVLGFASDAGVKRNKGRPGARLGPQAIRLMMAGLPAHGISAFVDAGDVSCHGDELEQAQQELGTRVAQGMGNGSVVVVLGGGHEVAWGSFQGLSAHLQQQQQGHADAKAKVLIVNLDAHFDLRNSRPGNSGTPFDQILRACREQGIPAQYACFGISRLGNTPALYQHAAELGVMFFEDVDMQERHLQERLEDVDRLLDAAHHVHLSIDLDVLPAAVAPGVSAPAPFGVPLSVIEALMQRIKESGKLRLVDIAEMNPSFDVDNHTARVAARLAWGALTP